MSLGGPASCLDVELLFLKLLWLLRTMLMAYDVGSAELIDLMRGKLHTGGSKLLIATCQLLSSVESFPRSAC